MSGAVVASTAGAGAAAAAARAARMREEEEQMTGYNKNDLDSWEFKIVRSNTSKFKDYKVVQKVCEEEAKAGWEMLEKFDDQRIRFKRPIEKRKNDQYLDIDPYRTNIGISEGKLVLTILGVISAIAGLGLLFYFIIRGSF